MKINSKDLLDAVNAVSPACPSKSPLLIAQLIHIESVSSEIVVTATDLENNFSFRFLKSEIDEESFSVCVEPKLLIKALEGIDCVVDFNVNQKKKIVTLAYDNFFFTLPFLPGEDFPGRIDEQNYYEFGIHFNVVKNLIEDAIGFASTDTLKPSMYGVNFELEDEKLTLVATDGHRLCKTQSVSVQRNEKDKKSFILEVNAAKKLKATTNSLSYVTVRVSNKWISIVGDKFTYNCRRQEAVFPNYRVIVEQPRQNILLVNKKELLNKLKKIVLFSSDVNYLGKFSISRDANLITKDFKMYIVAENSDLLSMGSTEVPILDVEGEHFPDEIGFNIKLFMSCLSFFDGNEVKLCFNGGNSSTAVMFCGVSDSDQDKFSVLMPILLDKK